MSSQKKSRKSKFSKSNMSNLHIKYFRFQKSNRFYFLTLIGFVTDFLFYKILFHKNGSNIFVCSLRVKTKNKVILIITHNISLYKNFKNAF